MTYIYGPMIEHNFDALQNSPEYLADSNGFWRSILSLSNYVALDVPVLTRNSASAYDAEVLFDTSELKRRYIGQVPDEDKLTQDAFSSIPQSFHEDDVDTGIHFLFSHLLHEVCFEGMCNPPGGDWSGLSVLYGDSEVRWLSLPRESKAIDGKRPDHVLELFGVFDCPVLLSIESKERPQRTFYEFGNKCRERPYKLHLQSDALYSERRTIDPSAPRSMDAVEPPGGF